MLFVLAENNYQCAFFYVISTQDLLAGCWRQNVINNHLFCSRQCMKVYTGTTICPLCHCGQLQS